MRCHSLDTRWTYLCAVVVCMLGGTAGCDVFSLRRERVRRSALWPLRKADGDAWVGLAGYGDGVLGRALVEPYYFLLLCW